MAVFRKIMKYGDRLGSYDTEVPGFFFPYKYLNYEYDINNITGNGNAALVETTSTTISGYRGLGEARQKNNDNTSGFILKYGGSTVRGYPMLITAESTSPPIYSAVSILESAVISGKYRFKKNISWGANWEKLFDTTVSVNVNINSKPVRAVILCSDKNWERTQQNPTSQPSAIYIQTYNEYGEGINAPPDLYGGYSNDGITLAGEYENMVWDFGSLPQEVPSVWAEWLNSNADAIYTNTYKILSQDGRTVMAEISEAPSVNSVSVNEYGRIKTVILVGTNGREYTLTWESDAPQGKAFRGLAYDVNSTRASLPVGQVMPVTLDNGATWYEVYATYKPPITTFDINLYNNNAEINRVDKSAYLESAGTLSGALRGECSLERPAITFKSMAVPTFNYVYIAAFMRYYYVMSITSVSKDMWRMELNCDVLHTYREQIKALTAVIGRQENDVNVYLNDPELPAQANQNVTVTEFPAGGFNTADTITCPFVLTVVGA